MPAHRFRPTLALALVAIACRPAATPTASSQATPPEPPASPPAEVAPPPATPTAPPDPLAGLDAAAQWRWAVERLPRLGELATGPTGTLDLLVPDGGTVTLHSPDVAEHSLDMFRAKPCAPMTFLREGTVLATRVPLAAGAARPDLRDNYTILRLADHLEVGPTVQGDSQGMTATSGYQPPQRSAVEKDAIHYRGRSQGFAVECAWSRIVRRCPDGSQSECRACDPVLIEVPRYSAQGGAMSSVPSKCEPCPPEGAEIADALNRVVQERRSLVIDVSFGAAFFRDKKACTAARAALNAAAAASVVQEPVPDKLYDLVVSFISPGDGTDHAAADRLERIVIDAGPTLEHARGRWGKEGEHDECFDLSGLTPKARKRFLAAVKSKVASSKKVRLAEKATCHDDRR